MGFPVFFVFAFFFVALLIATLVIYLQIYKSHINKALHSEEKPAVIAPPYKVAIVLTIIVLMIGIFSSYLVGYKVANDRFMTASMTFDVHSFYAKVKEIDQNTITVDGISINDEKDQGEFKYEVYEGVGILWKEEPICLLDIAPGDFVCITLVTGGGGITELFKIQLLKSNIY